jgi:hypothetical protein
VPEDPTVRSPVLSGLLTRLSLPEKVQRNNGARPRKRVTPIHLARPCSEVYRPVRRLAAAAQGGRLHLLGRDLGAGPAAACAHRML